eukprot:comp12232_c1_seq1/m.7019 comp12232_c1_seq1/g.7019  ORF comp12232_c1_seq1/g.7019 comp12232_c1_seq1/m.7019 type:complete len:418 (-) comp12232_c1_seq1:71-1324(-)
MSQKQPKPTLTGQRLRTRKRDNEKHAKFDPESFRDAVVVGLNEANGDFDAAARFLDLQGGSKLDYSRYGETLFDILFAGGILASGGMVEEDGEGKTSFCVFGMENEEKLKEFSELLNKLTRRYKYLIKTANENVIKNFKFLAVFGEKERQNFATLLAINFTTHAIIAPTVLTGLLADHLVKDEMALKFLTQLLQVLLKLGPEDAVANLMRKAGIENRLLEFFPENKRREEVMEAHFSSNGLTKVVEMYRRKEQGKQKGEFKTTLKEMFERGDSAADIIAKTDEFAKRTDMASDDLVALLWASMMAAIDWNKKPDLLEKDALRHIKANHKILGHYCSNGKTQLHLLLCMQSFCYDNMDFMKLFTKMVTVLYNTDVVAESVVQKWFKDGHSQKGKSVFLKQMQPMIDWLNAAEEESDEE